MSDFDDVAARAREFIEQLEDGDVPLRDGTEVTRALARAISTLRSCCAALDAAADGEALRLHLASALAAEERRHEVTKGSLVEARREVDGLRAERASVEAGVCQSCASAWWAREHDQQAAEEQVASASAAARRERQMAAEAHSAMRAELTAELHRLRALAGDRGTMTLNEEKQLRDACASATPAPWPMPHRRGEANVVRVLHGTDDVGEDDGTRFAAGPEHAGSKYAETDGEEAAMDAAEDAALADAVFISLARSAVPVLLAERDALRADVARQQAENDAMRAVIESGASR